MKALILAGGFATRLWPLTEVRAKPLLLLDGKTILAHILEKIPEGVDIILLTNERFKWAFVKELQHLEMSDRAEIFCEDAHSDGEKLGALGALSAVIHEYNIEEEILILAGDNLLPDLDFQDLFCEKNTAKIALREVKDKHEARKFGVVEVKAGNDPRDLEVIAFEEKPKKPKSTLVSTGFMSMGQDLFPLLHQMAKTEPDALGGIFPLLLNKKKTVQGIKVSGDWFDVGSFETYLEAHKSIQKKATLKDKSVDESGNQFLGKVFVGEGCEIKNSILVDAVIYPGVCLKNCHISQTVIDENCDFKGVDLNRKLVRRNTRLWAEE